MVLTSYPHHTTNNKKVKTLINKNVKIEIYMNEAQLLKRLQLLKKRPDLAKELSPTELAELVVVVLGYAKDINQKIEQQNKYLETVLKKQI